MWEALLSPNLQNFQFIQSAKGPEGENKQSLVIKNNLLLDSAQDPLEGHFITYGEE